MDIMQFEREMIQTAFQGLYLEKAKIKQERIGLHASSVLVNQNKWCLRKHALINAFPEHIKPVSIQSWDWKREKIFTTGWDLHERWQKLFLDTAQSLADEDIRQQWLEMFGQFSDPAWNAELSGWELDLTHFNEGYEVYFSPDAILQIGPHQYIVEIKGIKQEYFDKLTDDLEQACTVYELIKKARIQANIYMHLTGLKKAILLIENKNTQEFRIYLTQYDKALFEPYHERMLNVKAATINAKRSNGLQVLPQRVCQSPEDRLARQCPIRDYCFRENR